MTKIRRLALAVAAAVAVLWPATMAAAADLGDPALTWSPVEAIPGDFARPCVVGSVTGRTDDALTITLRWDEQRDPTCTLTSDEFPAARVMLWTDLGDPGQQIDYVMGPYREDNAAVGWTEFHTDPTTITLPGPGRYFAYFQGGWYGVGFLTIAGGPATASSGRAGTPVWVWPVGAVVVLAAAGAFWWVRRR